MVRKRTNGYKKLGIILMILLIILMLVNFNNVIILFQSKFTGYNTNTIAVFHELDVYDSVKKYKYSDTLEKTISADSFQKEYIDDYLNIKYHDSNDFINSINTLLSIGYNYKDINIIYDKLSLDNISLLLDDDYFDNIFNILSLDYFYDDYFSRYLNYNKKVKLNYDDIVTYVNIGLDNNYYTNVSEIDNPDDILVLVNKYNVLSSDYVPNDLEEINKKYGVNTNNKLRHVARVSFEKMCEDALKDNIKIYSGSAYRSYNYQFNLYNNYVASDGKKIADSYAARAGYSEHQTGLATDILNANFVFVRATDKEYTWLINNAYKYGFVLRYPQDKEDVTGYMYETWHFRYLGNEVAKTLHNLNITYDEYVARNLKNS